MEQQTQTNSPGATQQTLIPTPALSVPHRGKATAGLVLGIVGLFAWLIPLIGYPVTIVGIVVSSIGLKSDKQGQAIAGLVMGIIGLVGTIINSVLGVILLNVV